MKIDLKDNPDELNYISREIPVKCKYSGENESKNTFKIFIKHETLNKIDEYLSGDLQNELGGVVLGDTCADSSGKKFIFIDNLIIAKHSNSSLSRLTFTHETWDYISDIQENEYPDRKILGWFHSHPGHTVFLSNYDIFIHENFFNMEYMVAYVFDPTIKERGFFYWQEGKIVKANGYYIVDPVEDDFEDEFSNELLPDFKDTDIDNNEIDLKKVKPVVKTGKNNNGKKPEIKGAVLIALLFLALIVLLFMIYNIYDIKQKALLKDEYLKDLTEIRDENRILTERLNNLIAESELKKGKVSGQVSGLADTDDFKTIENEKKQEVADKKPDISEVKKELPVQEKETPGSENNNTEDVTVYKVKSGDTLEKISNQFYKSRDGIKIIMEKNNLKDKASIKIGQQLLIPVSMN